MGWAVVGARCGPSTRQPHPGPGTRASSERSPCTPSTRCMDDGVDFIFNTPNEQSRPGYLKMGWQALGHLTPWVRVRVQAAPTLLGSRTLASHWAEPCTVGGSAQEVLADDDAVEQLLISATQDGRLHTARSPSYLRWRYDHELLGYRVLSLGDDVADGVACFRLRRRGRALEATVCDLLVPGNAHSRRAELLRRVLHETGADYCLLLGGGLADGTLPLPRGGPALRLAGGPPPRSHSWTPLAPLRWAISSSSEADDVPTSRPSDAPCDPAPPVAPGCHHGHPGDRGRQCQHRWLGRRRSLRRSMSIESRFTPGATSAS